MADVFISYSHEDRDRVERLASTLDGVGFSLWWDRQVDAGAEFSKDIERELDAAKAVIVVWSDASKASAWVRDEASYASSMTNLLPSNLMLATLR